ncbi:MAG: HYR domain-containing protein, partial [Bacteroidota bacterium]
MLNEDDNCANASSITLVSPNDPLSEGIPSDTRHCVTMVASQNVTFDWTYSTLDLDPTHDPFGYSINGIFTQLSDDIGASTHSGSETIPVLAGAEFCLILSTIDNRGGSATTVIDRFIANQLIAATYVDGTSVNLGCPGEFYFDRTWSLSDGCGNAAASQVQRITVLDRTAPVVTTTNNSLDPDIDNYICGTAYTFNAGPQLCFLSKTIAKPEWIDACGSTVTRTQSATNNVTISNYGSFVSVDFPVGTTTVSFRAQDCPGNTAICSVTVTIIDNQTPTLTGCPQNQTWAGDQNACTKTITLVIPTAGDNCAVTSVTHTLSGATTLVDNEFPNQLDLNYGVTSIVYAAFDAAGNSATCSFTVNVTDPQPPTVTCPANMTVVADAGVCYHTTAGGLFDATVVDNCPIIPIFTVFGATSASGSASLNGVQFDRGLSTVTWSATDMSSANATCSFVVRVNDTEPPTVPADAGSTVACLAAATVPVIASATDNCTGSINVELLSVVDNPASLTCEGTRTYTYEYSDASGNIASDKWIYTYTVEYQDYTMPANSGSTVACFADITLPTPPSVNDNCGSAITPTGPVTGGTYTSCEGTYTYTWSYTDCEGNTHPWVYTYTIERNDFSMPANGSSTVACIAAATAPVPPSVNDNCGNTIIPTGPATGGTYTSCEGTRTYTYTYTDCEGNSHPWVYTYTIEREDFTMPANGSSTVACIASATPPTPPTVTDACGNALTPVGPPVVSGTYTSCEGTRIYTYTYTDCEGNTHPWVYTYTIEREELTVPAWGSSTVSCITQFTQPTPPVVTDACGNVLTPTGPNLGINYNNCEGIYAYSWTYTDCEGNTSDWVYSYIIDNNTPPAVTNTSSSFDPDFENYVCGASYTFPAGQSSCIINKSLAVPAWADDCGA